MWRKFFSSSPLEGVKNLRLTPTAVPEVRFSSANSNVIFRPSHASTTTGNVVVLPRRSLLSSSASNCWHHSYSGQTEGYSRNANRFLKNRISSNQMSHRLLHTDANLRTNLAHALSRNLMPTIVANRSDGTVFPSSSPLLPVSEDRLDTHSESDGRQDSNSEEDKGGRGAAKGRHGLLLAGAILAGLDEDEQDLKQSNAQPQEKSMLQALWTRLAKLPLMVNAAEPLNPSDGDDGGQKPRSRRERFNFISEVVAETAPALVYIEIKDTGVRDYFTGQPVTSSNGSGFIVKEDGLILTNAHVVINKPRSSIQVRLHDGEVYAGVVEDVDVRSDLATVRIPCKNLPIMKLGSSAGLKPGEWVIAMGSPLSLSNTITTGIVSNVARPPDELGLQGRDVPQYIQTDAAITFGNSGGPLINLDGEAIGINSMKVTPGISFAIPIDYAKEFLTKSEEARRSGWPSGTGKRRYIGITMVSLSHQMIDELKSRNQITGNVQHGILIYRLVVGSPAERAGLLPGDIVTTINGRPIHGSRDVYKLLESNESELVMTVTRNRVNKVLKITVVPESQH